MLAWNFVLCCCSESINFVRNSQHWVVFSEALCCDCNVLLHHSVTLSRVWWHCLMSPGPRSVAYWCHSPGPRVPSPLSVSPLGLLAGSVAGLAGCHRAGQLPPSRHVTSFVTRATPDIGQLRPGRVLGGWGCSAHLSHCPHPGTWSHWSLVTLVTPGHTWPTRVTITIIIRPCPPSLLLLKCPRFLFVVIIASSRSYIEDWDCPRLASEPHNVSLWLDAVTVMIASYINATHACFDA